MKSSTCCYNINSISTPTYTHTASPRWWLAKSSTPENPEIRKQHKIQENPVSFIWYLLFHNLHLPFLGRTRTMSKKKKPFLITPPPFPCYLTVEHTVTVNELESVYVCVEGEVGLSRQIPTSLSLWRIKVHPVALKEWIRSAKIIRKEEKKSRAVRKRENENKMFPNSLKK